MMLEFIMVVLAYLGFMFVGYIYVGGIELICCEVDEEGNFHREHTDRIVNTRNYYNIMMYLTSIIEEMAK